MNWTHSSKAVVLGALLAVSLVAVGTAAAASYSGESPDPKNVNDTASMTVTIEDPFEDQPDQWTLNATSELDNASWNVEVYEQGQRVGQDGGQGSIEVPLDRSGDTTPDRIEITVEGEVPDEISYNYGDRGAENYTVVTLTNTDTGDQLRTWESHRYTDGSNEARTAIDNASAAIDELENPSDDVQSRLDQAISAYNQGNFDNAVDIASEAESMAEDEQSSGLPIALIAGAAVLVLVVVGGGVYYWRSQQQETHKLQ